MTIEELKIGSTLQNGKYMISKVLGAGSFGISYLATTKLSINGPLGKMEVAANVAIKEFYMKDLNCRVPDKALVEGTQNPLVNDYRQKFRKEAINLSKLHHKNIVKVIDVFDENNTTYYVMEYVKGGTLDDYIHVKGKLAECEALDITMSVGEALAYMHTNKMLHLDMKPKNIMRDTKGNVFLIDFGLSKQYNKNGEPESSTSIGLGTPGYAPIEQANNKQGKTGSIPMTIDVYALGATLFKMLTGKIPPFASTVLNDGFPSDSLSQAGVSHATIMIVEKAMSPMRKQRYQTIDDMLHDIAMVKDVSSADDDTPDDEETIIMVYVDDDKPKHQKPWSKKKLFVIGITAIIMFFGWVYFLYDNATSYDMGAKMPPVGKEASASTTAEKNIANSDFVDIDDIEYPKEIDLGLSSGNIWAGWNIGASKAEDAGGLYAWGETTPRKVFKNYFDSSFTKYTLAKGATSILHSNHDAAHVAWGHGWRMPTKSEIEELCEGCTWRKTTYKGSKGIVGQGPNGNTIFFPVTGYGNENGIWYRKGVTAEGDYFCGELCNPKKHDHSSYDPIVNEDALQSMRAYSYDFHYDGSGNIEIGCAPRDKGCAIRAVKPQPKEPTTGKSPHESSNKGAKIDIDHYGL